MVSHMEPRLPVCGRLWEVGGRSQCLEEGCCEGQRHGSGTSPLVFVHWGKSGGMSIQLALASATILQDAYPFMQGVDWTDDLYQKPVPGKSAQQVMQAVDKMIVMGSKMDGAALQEAAKAHVAAIDNMDSKGVLAQKDFESMMRSF